MSSPAWIDGLTHKDWWLDGYPIRNANMLARWHDLDWSEAWVDMGPSPMGNLGPYWHVPLESGDTTHRLYPKIPAKWLLVVRHAIEERVAKLNTEALQQENEELRAENISLRFKLMQRRAGDAT